MFWQTLSSVAAGRFPPLFLICLKWMEGTEAAPLRLSSLFLSARTREGQVSSRDLSARQARDSRDLSWEKYWDLAIQRNIFHHSILQIIALCSISIKQS